MKKNNDASECLNFWEGEECEYCGGALFERRIELYRNRRGNRILYENVPAGICRSCGARYYSAHVLKMLDRRAAEKGLKKETLRIPLVHFS